MIFSVDEEGDILLKSDVYMGVGLGFNVDTIVKVLEVSVDDAKDMSDSDVNVDNVVNGFVDVKSKVV